MTSLETILGETEVIAAVLGALLGAVVGGATTYLATARINKIQQRNLELSICAVILFEVYQHQASLALDLDRILPIWLGRHFYSPQSATKIRELTASMPHLSDRAYSQFFPAVVTTSVGVSLISYYSRLGGHNELARQFPEGVPGDLFANYVRRLALLLEGGISIIDRIRTTKGISPWLQSEEHGLIFEDFDSQRDRFLYMAALSRVSCKDLRALEESKPLRDGFPTILREDSRQRWRGWYDDACELRF